MSPLTNSSFRGRILVGAAIAALAVWAGVLSAGVRIPHRLETTFENATKNQVVVWEQATTNPMLSTARFERPDRNDGLVRITGGAMSTDWMPMDLYRERYIFLKGTVNGHETEIILDSGAAMTVLDRPIADAIGLKSEGSVPAQGTGGTTTAGIVSGITLKIGALEMGPAPAAVLELADVNRRLGRDLPVILGKEVFHNLVVDIDYPNSRIRFHNAADFTYEGPGRKLPVKANDSGLKDIEIEVEGLPKAPVGLDTGQGGALSLFRAYTDDNDLLRGRALVSSRKAGGVGGSTIDKVSTLSSVTIAGYRLHNVPVSFHRENVGGVFDTRKRAGNLGTGILNRFRVIFDYSNDCLWLEPGEGWDVEPFPKDKTGLAFLYEGDRLSVSYVAPGSPAAAQGWKTGDVVIALGDAPVEVDWWVALAGWQRADDGTEVQLTLEDQTTRRLVLRTYY